MDQPTNPNRFSPPSAQRLAQHLAQHPPVRVGVWQQRGPALMAIAMTALALLLIGQPTLAILPLLALFGLMAYLSTQARNAAQLSARATRAWELAMIRQYRQALRQAWDLLPACRTKPELHGKTVTVIAHILGELNQHDAAEVAYTYLLDRLPPQHPVALRLRLQRAITALTTGQLADGDDALRKLRALPQINQDPTLKAAYHHARLVQDTYTGHYASALEITTPEDLFRPLGTEAGYSYALLAYCYHQHAKYPSHASDPENNPESAATSENTEKTSGGAQRYWQQATLLVPPAAIIHRYPELAPLADSDVDVDVGRASARLEQPSLTEPSQNLADPTNTPNNAKETFQSPDFAKRMATDQLIRNAFITLTALAILATLLLPATNPIASILAPLTIMGLWLWLSLTTAKVARLLAPRGSTPGSDPAPGNFESTEETLENASEDAVKNFRGALRAWPVMRWARQLTYYRLAALRYRQHRYRDTANICLCLLNEPLKGPAAGTRPHLLLMLAHAQLENHNLPGVYHALAHLQQTKLTLDHALQRLSLQTRYELAIGANDAALHRARAKVELAELMPPQENAQMHALLATAADRTGQTKQAHWLWQRNALLSDNPTPPPSN